MTDFTGPDLCALSAVDAVTLLRKGDVSRQEIQDAAFARIAQVEPAINALPILCADRAREFAKQLTGPGDSDDSWLAGLPVAIKDLTNVAGVKTTFGSPGFADFIADKTDAGVDRIETNGGVVIAKSNTPEFGAGGNTFNPVFGRTRNPWNTSRNAGGSSGGSAAALAAGEVWLAQGSDLAGSLRTPAAYCGVVGLRPTPGRVPVGPGDVPFSTEGLSGPMARTVGDLALFLDAMVGFDPRDPLSLEKPAQSYQSEVSRAGQSYRIAYSPDLNGFAPVESDIDTILRGALAKMQKTGCTIDEACPELPTLYDTYITLRGMRWASGPGQLPEDKQRHFKDTLRQNIDLGHALTTQQIYDAQRGRGVIFANMLAFLQTHDVLACPVVGLKPGPIEEEYPLSVAGQKMNDYVDWLRFSYLATTAALPALSLPVGFTDDGMPVGMQLIGPPRGEARLLAVAATIERQLDLPTKTPIDPVVTH